MDKVNSSKIAAEAANSQNKKIPTNIATQAGKQISGLFDTEEIKESPKIDSLNSEKEVKAPTINEDKAEEYAAKLIDAMGGIIANGSTVDEILLNDSLNSYDIISILDKYESMNKNHHYLTNDLALKFMGSHEDKLLQRIMEACFEVYADGSGDNLHLNWRAKNALNTEAIENFMLEKGIITEDYLMLKRSGNVMTGIRG